MKFKVPVLIDTTNSIPVNERYVCIVCLPNQPPELLKSHFPVLCDEHTTKQQYDQWYENITGKTITIPELDKIELVDMDFEYFEYLKLIPANLNINEEVIVTSEADYLVKKQECLALEKTLDQLFVVPKDEMIYLHRLRMATGIYEQFHII